MPADPKHPERGYLTPSTGTVVMDFKLPDDLVGSRVILQVRCFDGSVLEHANLLTQTVLLR